MDNALNKLTCIVRGNPEPEITWYKNGEKVDRPETLTRSNAGQYTINASNTLGNLSVTVDIYIICTYIYPLAGMIFFYVLSLAYII